MQFLWPATWHGNMGMGWLVGTVATRPAYHTVADNCCDICGGDDTIGKNPHRYARRAIVWGVNTAFLGWYFRFGESRSHRDLKGICYLITEEKTLIACSYFISTKRNEALMNGCEAGWHMVLHYAKTAFTCNNVRYRICKRRKAENRVFGGEGKAGGEKREKEGGVTEGKKRARGEKKAFHIASCNPFPFHKLKT